METKNVRQQDQFRLEIKERLFREFFMPKKNRPVDISPEDRKATLQKMYDTIVEEYSAISL